MQNTHDLLVGTLSIGIPSNIVHKNLLPRIKLDLSENHWVIWKFAAGKQGNR